MIDPARTFLPLLLPVGAGQTRMEQEQIGRRTPLSRANATWQGDAVGFRTRSKALSRRRSRDRSPSGARTYRGSLAVRETLVPFAATSSVTGPCNAAERFSTTAYPLGVVEPGWPLAMKALASARASSRPRSQSAAGRARVAALALPSGGATATLPARRPSGRILPAPRGP